MKKKVFSLMMTLLLAFMGVAKAETIEIGTGTGTSYYVPFNSLYGYSFTEQIYSASDIGIAGSITSISFYLGTSSSVEQTNDIALYMKNVSRSTFSSTSDYETVTPGDIVFQGQWTIPMNYTGWVTINLDTPFAYDGSSNLMVAMHEYTSGYSTRYFTYTSVSNASVQWYSDTYNPDPYNLGSYSGSSYVRSYLGNAQLEITAGGSGGGVNGEITLHDGGVTNGNIPVYGFYADAYLKAEMVYPAAELSEFTGGTINSMKFYSSNSSISWGSANFQVFLTEVADASVNSFNGPGTVVYTGALSIDANGEMMVNFDTPYQYNGGNLLVGFYNTVKGSYVSCSWYGETVTGASYSDYSYSSLAEITSGIQRNFLPKTTIAYTTAGGGGEVGDQLHVRYMEGENAIVDSLNLGVRPINAWMEPFNFTMFSEGPVYTVTVLDFTPSDGLFSVEGEELPFVVNRTTDVDLVMATNATEAGVIERQFVAITEGNRAAHIWPLVVEMYDPAIPDVWEKAYDFGTIAAGFSYQGVPSAITPTVLHNDYTLPFPEIPEGVDAVYKFTVANDVIIDACVDPNAQNGKVALYAEGFNGEGGPMATNYYTGLDAAGGGAAATPFEIQIGNGTSTTGYLPMYYLYNYSLSTQLYLGTELAEAGATTAPMTSISWYSESTYGYNIQNISIWMANVTDTQVSSTTPLGNNMSLVYQGNFQEVVGWNEFVFNAGGFAWDGSSNVMVMVQMNNGSWSSSISWQCHNAGFTAGSYVYQDNTPYSAGTTSYTGLSTTTNRANTVFKGGNRERATVPVTFNMADTYGDGWNGNYLNVTASDGTNESITFTSGYSGSYTLNFAEGAHVTLTWTSGSYSYETSFNVVMGGETIFDGDYTNLPFEFDIPGGGGGGNTGNTGVCAGPVITDLPLRAGTYYLVASATQPDYDVFINVDNMPCPAIEAEGFAFNPQPADNEDEVEPDRVTLRWMVPEFATGWRLIFGTTYHPEANHPQTIIYPEDGSWETNMANSFTVRNLYNNNNYFWRVEFNNDGCPDGVSSPVWGFTTHLNVPQNLTAVDETVFDDENIVLNWTPVVDRTYRQYNVYQDGVLIGNTQVNNIGNSTYTVAPLPYNMGGYVFYVTAVYDEGESAPSNTVTVKVSGRGNVDGHVYEQDGTTGIAGATVTMTGRDEFGVNHTYNFQTNGQGYYAGAVYAGSYNGSAALDGYQTITEPVQGNPIAITYNQTTSPIDYMLDENFDPVCAVIAQYYPDSLDPTAPYVKVYWGCGLPGSEIIEDFETGDFSLFDWQVDPTYPWSITTTNPYEGVYCMKSGGAGVASVTSNMTVTVDIPADGEMSFFGKISSESNYDYGHFYIDGVEMGNWSGAGNWTERTYAITAGEHTFQWRYTKDSSVNSNDDCFYVDYISFYKQPAPPIPGMTYDFDNSTMQGWTSLDADGDGYGWYVASDIMSTGYGHNSSNDCVLSQSYYSGLVLYPDNYLVSPQVELGGVLRFYACAQDNMYAAEHFGVAVSTTTNNNPSAFTMLNEWTMTAKAAKGGIVNKDVDAMGHSRNGNTREQGNWYEYTVDLSAYSGMGYVAIRHFNCSDMFYLDVDDITIGEPGKSAPENSRAFAYYRIYRTDCYNDGPYTEENTELLASEVTDTVYIDTYWPDVAPGVYKWGVSCVYAGNRGELIETPISWTAPVNMSRTFTTSEAAQISPKATKQVVVNPEDRNRDYLQYSTEVFDGGVGTGGGAVYWGIRFPAADLAAYAGQSLTKVGIFMDLDGDYGWTYSGNYTARVFQGGATAPGTLVSETTEYLPGDMAWHDITLTTPVAIDATQDLWLTFYTADIAYPMAGCTYVGNPNSDFLSLDGITWEHSTDYALDYTWMIRGLVENGGPTPPTPPTPGQPGSTVVNFENGIPTNWVNTSNYPWIEWNTNPNGGNTCLASGNYNVASSTSYIEATVDFVVDGSIEFYSRISSESATYDHGDFSIDGVVMLTEGGTTPNAWASHTYNVTAGTHTFRWSYTKDSSVNSGEDRYYLDDVTFVGTSAGNTGLQEPRESEIVWSNCLEKGMYLGEGAVDVTVLLNSADSPEGVTVTFTNYNEYEQELYPIAPIVLDETGYYAFDLFRKGDYQVKVEFDGYEPITEDVSIWDPTSLRYVMIEIIYGVNNLYVSSTGWAMWDAQGLPPTPGPNPGPGGNGDTFSENFDGGMPAGWTTVDADGDGLTWVSSMTPGIYHNAGVDLTGTGHNASTAYVISGSWANGTGQVLYPDNYLVSPQVNLAAGSTFSFWACAQDASYPADHFGVAISDNGTSNWTMVNEWTMTAKDGNNGVMSYGRDGDTRVQGNWYNYSVDLSAYAGQKYIAIRHFNCSDQFILNVDDIELTAGAKAGERHLEYFKVMCESLDHEPIFNADTEHPFCQVATDELVPGDHYLCKVAAVYSTGMSDWVEAEWQYIPCDNYAGTLNGIDVNGTTVSWDYPNGSGPVPPQPGQGDSWQYDFENSSLAGLVLIDGGNPTGYGWQLGSTKLGAGYGHNGSSDLILSQSYDNNYGVIYPDNYVIFPQSAIATGSTFSFWACGQDANYAAEHFGVAVSTTGTNAGDFSMVNEWTIGQKGDRYNGPRGMRDQSAWTQYSVDLSAYAGQQIYIAIRHFNCSDMFYLDVDDVALTSGAKSNRDVVAFNGYVTDPGAMANGADASWTKNGQATWGPNVNNASGYKLADSFTLSAATTISEIEVYGYQTGSSTTSTFTGFYAQIYDGNPMSGGNAIWGSETSNIMTATSFTNCYRGSDGETTATTRPIMAITAGNLNIDLAAGTYWLVYSLEGTGTSGPWGAPHAEPGVGNTGNGVQYASGWQTLVDGGTGAGYGCAMKITGSNGTGPTPPPATGDILGAMVFLNGEWEAFVPYPTNEYTYEEGGQYCVRMVYNGTNTLPEGNIYYSMSCPECEGGEGCAAGAPIYAEELHATDQVRIWWGDQPTPPATPVEDWLYYDDGANVDAIGLTTGGSFYWGIKFPANTLGQYEGCSVTKIGYFDYGAHTGTVRIYNGSVGNGPGTLIGTYNYTANGTEDWVEWNIPAVAFNNTQDLWIVMNNDGGQYVASMGNYTGDPNGTMISTDGSTWYTLDEATGGAITGTWNLRCFVTNQAKGGEVVVLEDQKNGTPNGVIANAGIGKQGHAPVYATAADIVKYNVYRSTDNANYTMIGEVAAVAGQTYYEYIDTPESAGTYYYQVRADYGDCESEPAVSGENPSQNYVVAGVDAVGENDSNVALFPNPTNGNVTIQAMGMSRITVVSVLGQVVYDTELNADEFILNMAQFNAGMYMVRVYTEEGVVVKRVTVMQ